MKEEDGSVEGKDVMRAIDYIKDIGKQICWVPTKMALFDEWRSFLKGLADGEGLEVDYEAEAETDAQVERVKTAMKQGSRTKIRPETMSEVDLQILYDTLVDHFTSSQTSVARNPLDDEDDDVAELYDIFDKDGSDMGVTKYRKMGDQELMDLLDFPEGRPILFAKFRHKDTMTTPWDKPSHKMWEEGGEELLPLRLLWHQLCGVASIVDGIFKPKGKRVRNRLLADDVGIGKSAQVMGVIAFLILVWYLEKKKAARPPIIQDSKCIFRRPQCQLIFLPQPTVSLWAGAPSQTSPISWSFQTLSPSNGLGS